MMDRALMNLMCNAGKFTEENGKVSLQLKELSLSLVLQSLDTMYVIQENMA